MIERAVWAVVNRTRVLSAEYWHYLPGPVTAFRRFALIDRTAVAVIVLAAVAVLTWLSARDFPLGVHPDEIVKVEAVLRGPSTYYHPLLMIDLVRVANGFLGLRDPQSIVELGRAFSAAAGGVLVVATFILARLILPASVALAVAAATVVTPLISVHARYFKEDIFVAAFVTLALAVLISILQTPTTKRAIILGVAIGLAAGSKYVGGIILLPYALAIIIVVGDREQIATRLLHAAIATFTAITVLGLIDIPAVFAGNQFLSDLRLESLHATTGHRDIVLPITLTSGIFHLRESLWPGLGALLTILGVLGLSACFFSHPEQRRPLGIIAGFTVLWYLGHEISPLKPYPDFARYMIPIAPLLAILGGAFVYYLVESYRAGVGAAASIVVLIVAAVPAAWHSLQINVGAHDDPRRMLPEIVAMIPAYVAVDSYAGYQTRPFLTQLQVLPSVASSPIIVTSSFNYDRYKRYGALPQQSIQTQEGAKFYTQILALPHIDISNGRPSFGFFNPTTTIVAMDGKFERLLPIAKIIKATAPSLFVQLHGSMPRQP